MREKQRKGEKVRGRKKQGQSETENNCDRQRERQLTFRLLDLKLNKYNILSLILYG